MNKQTNTDIAMLLSCSELVIQIKSRTEWTGNFRLTEYTNYLTEQENQYYFMFPLFIS